MLQFNPPWSGKPPVSLVPATDKDFLPPSPWEGPPVPRALVSPDEPGYEYRELRARMQRLEEALPLIAADIRKVWAEAKAVYLVGSYARGEARIDSDIDILVVFPEGTDGWAMVQRDKWLFKKWNRRVLGTRVNFIVYVEGGRAIVGKHRERLEARLATPMRLLL